MVLFAKAVTKIWVEPFLEAGAPEDTPIERQGCGPFDRVSNNMLSFRRAMSNNQDSRDC